MIIEIKNKEESFIVKKFFGLIICLTIAVLSLFGCSATPSHFTGEWRFDEVVAVSFAETPSESELSYLKETYNAQNETEILNNALASYLSNETFADFYLKFDGNFTYTYDPFADREATWKFYQISENEGFISYDTELDVTNGNPFPTVFPDITYDTDANATFITINDYGSFMITLKLTR